LPKAAVEAALEPDMAPNISAAATVVIGTPAGIGPTKLCTQLISRCVMPPRSIITPAKMKPGTAINTRLSRPPKRVDVTTVKDTLVKTKRTTIELTRKTSQIGIPNASRTNARIARTAVMARSPSGECHGGNYINISL
jgi:hypothetical protein